MRWRIAVASSGSAEGGGAFGSGMKVDSTSSLPRVCPLPEKKPRPDDAGPDGSAPGGGPALQTTSKLKMINEGHQKGVDVLGGSTE